MSQPTYDLREEPQAVLRWTCETCGWTCCVPMPGYPGDGHRHYTGLSGYGCGPLVARRVGGMLRLRLGLPGREVDECVASYEALEQMP